MVRQKPVAYVSVLHFPHGKNPLVSENPSPNLDVGLMRMHRPRENKFEKTDGVSEEPEFA